MTGHQAIIAAAKRAGCTFVAARPSPAVEPLPADAGEQLEVCPRRAAALEQCSVDNRPPTVQCADDDIAAAGDCVAAAAGGATPLLLTSGAALAACRENLALAQVAELPLVTVHCQHLGSAGGGLLLVGDTDVALARHMGLAGVLLPVLATADAVSAFQLTYSAFSVARRLRTPVIVLTAFGIGASEQAVNVEDLRLPAEAESDLRALAARVSFDTAARPGFVQFSGLVSGQRVFLNFPPDEIEARLSRLRDKIVSAAPSLEFFEADIDPDAETLLLSYGLAAPAARQAVDLVRRSGARVSHLTVHSLWPIAQRAIRRSLTPFIRRVLIPELNFGLYADELQAVLRNVKIESLARHDGGMIEPATIAHRLTDWPCG
jgi:2-oxoglutarate/2-oxoacid ferredoxin oxidoreductase subunit alpha